MPGPKSDKIWSAAIHKAVHEIVKDEDGKEVEVVVDGGDKIKLRKINLLATNFVAMALAGDVQATKEIGDRLDGKPHQTSESKTEVTSTFVAAMPDDIGEADEWQKKNAPTIQ